MGNEHVVPPPRQLYASPNGDSPAGWSYSDTPLDDEFVAYARIPEGIDPDDAVVISKKERECEDEQTTDIFDLMHSRMAAAEQKCAVLAEALKSARRTIISAVHAGCDLPDFDPTQHVTVVEIDDALAQQDQPEAR